MSVNKVILVGNLGKSAELRLTPSGSPVATFSMATSEKHNDKEVTQWHRVVLWGHTAEKLTPMLSKGTKVYVEGKITHVSWEDKNGKQNNLTEIVADKIELLSARPKREEPKQQELYQQGPAVKSVGNITTEEIPF